MSLWNRWALRPPTKADLDANARIFVLTKSTMYQLSYPQLSDAPPDPAWWARTHDVMQWAEKNIPDWPTIDPMAQDPVERAILPRNYLLENPTAYRRLQYWQPELYVCPQCGPDIRGAEYHAEKHHTLKGITSQKGPLSIERHGEDYAIYLGRDAAHHGLNIAYVSEIDPVHFGTVKDALETFLGDGSLRMSATDVEQFNAVRESIAIQNQELIKRLKDGTEILPLLEAHIATLSGDGAERPTVKELRLLHARLAEILTLSEAFIAASYKHRPETVEVTEPNPALMRLLPGEV